MTRASFGVWPLPPPLLALSLEESSPPPLRAIAPTTASTASRAMAIWPRFIVRGRYRRARLVTRSAAQRRALDVSMLDVDDVAVVVAEAPHELLDDRHRAMAAAGAADGHDEVRLALRDVLRQQVFEQRQDAAVELLETAVACDVLDDPAVEAGQRPQVRLVVGVLQEPHVEEEVGVACRAVLEAEGQERHGEAPWLRLAQHLRRDLAAQHRRAEARGVDQHVGAVADRPQQLR